MRTYLHVALLSLGIPALTTPPQAAAIADSIQLANKSPLDIKFT